MLSNELEQHNQVLEDQVREDITFEIYRAAKIPDIKWMRKLISHLVRKPVNRSTKLIVDFDTSVNENGFVFTSDQILNKLTKGVEADGDEFIPRKGPLVIASNHPGTYDGLSIISRLPRNDFRLIVSGIPFFKNLPNAGENLILTTHDTLDRMDVIRKSIRHLQDGGALLIFPSGRLDPDPSIFPDAGEGLKKWSRSIEVFLNKVPDAQLVLTIASGVLTNKYINHPLLKLFKNDHERRRFMEFMQILNQMATGKPVELNPKVSFAKPLTQSDSLKTHDSISEHSIFERAVELLNYHMNLYYE